MLVLALLGLLSTLVYSLELLLRFPLLVWWQTPLLDYTWFTGYSLEGQLRYVVVWAVLFGLYGGAYCLLRRRPQDGPLGLILAGQLAMGLPLVWTYSIAANDLYDYLLYGRIELYWGGNPLAQPPSQFPNEPLVAYSYWPHEPSVYGPLWQVVSVWLTGLVEGQLPDGLIAFKLLGLAASLATTAVLWLALRGWRAELAPSGALLYGWNPLQLFESAGNAHNDALMVLFLTLALLALYRGRASLALPAFALGLLVKITIAPLAPVLALATLRSSQRLDAGARRLAVGAVLAALLVIGLYAPYWEGRASLPFLDRGNWFTASFPTLLRELFRRWQEFEDAGRSAATLSGFIFLVVALAILWRAWRSAGQGPETWALAGYQVFFAYLVLACLWWQPWYLMTLLALGAGLPSASLHLRANLFCAGGLLSYPVFKYIWAVHQADWQLDYFRIMAISVVAIFTLPLAHVAAEQLWRAARR